MKNKWILTALAVIGLGMSVQANTVTWNSFGNNVTLGTTANFLDTSSTYTLTASGFNTSGGTEALYGKNQGGDETGLGINSDPTGQHEITTSTFIQIAAAIAGGPPVATLTSLVLGSVQGGESAIIYGTSTPGTLNLATQLTVIADANGMFDLTPYLGQYAYFDVTAGAANVLLDSVVGTFTPTVPDGGTTVMLLGCALVGMGLFRKKVMV